MSQRVIKFRAWDAERKAIVSGQDIEEFTEEIDEVSYTYDAPRYTTGLSYGALFVAYTSKGGDFTECEVMQFTGLLDKNGKEIYEGDVVKGFRCVKNRSGQPTGEERFIGAVQYDEWWGAYRRNGVKQYQGISAELMHGRELEVIGNIYENPELLEVQK